jgi:hypothetical protein
MMRFSGVRREACDLPKQMDTKKKDKLAHSRVAGLDIIELLRNLAH